MYTEMESLAFFLVLFTQVIIAFALYRFATPNVLGGSEQNKRLSICWLVNTQSCQKNTSEYREYRARHGPSSALAVAWLTHLSTLNAFFSRSGGTRTFSAGSLKYCWKAIENSHSHWHFSPSLAADVTGNGAISTFTGVFNQRANRPRLFFNRIIYWARATHHRCPFLKWLFEKLLIHDISKFVAGARYIQDM